MTANPGYKLEYCRKNCPKSTQDWSELYFELEKMLNELDLATYLTKSFHQVHYHNTPKIALAGCPNGCSQPQIKDIGISGYLSPKMTDNFCSGCKACLDSCLEKALSWTNEEVRLDHNLCLECGDCIRACPTGKIISGESGWKIYLGGHLGRHPQFAKISGKEKTDKDVIHRIKVLLKDYLENALPSEKFNHFLNRTHLT
jgi:anaerobic sulfite reductase subunit C